MPGKSAGAWEQGYALGKIWRSPGILGEADLSHPDMDFSGNGMTPCQVSMSDSCGARPRTGSCKARQRSRLLAVGRDMPYEGIGQLHPSTSSVVFLVRLN